jgi:myo-inositol-1(or 4)-monophosphatase
MQPSVNIAIRAMRQARERMLLSLNQYELLTPASPQYTETLSFLHKDAYKLLFDAIKRAYPTHFVTDGADVPAGKDDSWHFLGIHAPDSLVRKDPASVLSLIHRQKGKIQDALVVSILGGDEYTASRGKGAALNERRMRCTAQTRLEHSLVATLPGTDAARDRGLSLLNELGRRSGDVRISGCQVLDLVMLAGGQRDAVATLTPNAAELEAALFICHEAGVLTSQLDGNPFNSRSGSLVAANPKLLKVIVQHLHTL